MMNRAKPCAFTLSIILPDMCDRNKWPHVNLSCQTWGWDYISFPSGACVWMKVCLCTSLWTATVTRRFSLCCCPAKPSGLHNSKWHNCWLTCCTSWLSNLFLQDHFNIWRIIKISKKYQYQSIRETECLISLLAFLCFNTLLWCLAVTSNKKHTWLSKTLALARDVKKFL